VAAPDPLASSLDVDRDLDPHRHQAFKSAMSGIGQRFPFVV
jgi:hypothetical protein